MNGEPASIGRQVVTRLRTSSGYMPAKMGSASFVAESSEKVITLTTLSR